MVCLGNISRWNYWIKNLWSIELIFLVGFQQGMKLSNLLSSANLAKTALEMKII